MREWIHCPPPPPRPPPLSLWGPPLSPTHSPSAELGVPSIPHRDADEWVLLGRDAYCALKGRCCKSPAAPPPSLAPRAAADAATPVAEAASPGGAAAAAFACAGAMEAGTFPEPSLRLS